MTNLRKIDEKYRLSLAKHLKGQKYVYLYKKPDGFKVYDENHLEHLFARLDEEYDPFEERRLELGWARKL